MPGTIVFRPIEANLTHNTDLIGKMNPYCAIIANNCTFKGQVCKKGGKNPHWNDAITVPFGNESKALLELMDKDKITKDDQIGSCVIDLSEIQSRGQISKWYPIFYKNAPAGEILMETTFQQSGDLSYTGQSQAFQGEQFGAAQTGASSYIGQTTGLEGQIGTAQSGYVQESGFTNQTEAFHEKGNVFVEQRQVVQPHTFMKEVDVVETRSKLQEVETLEPVQVIKDVLVTEAVPVKKQIEVTEPVVVTKEVEVIEPRVVTKTIEVVENVPVMKQVEVIENITTFKEVETMEPHTFTKQVNITEYVPVKKSVEVSEPVTVKKAVEFVEPVITTQTITKEVMQPVVVGQETTTTVGPATLVGIEAGTHVSQTSQSYLTEQERLLQTNTTSQVGGYSSTYQGDQQTYQTGQQSYAGGQQSYVSGQHSDLKKDKLDQRTSDYIPGQRKDL